MTVSKTGLLTKPTVVILGQTASGKSALALKVAHEYNGEILAADSRTIYKGMDIGTAKPSPEDQRTIKHYGLDLITPDKAFSAAEFKQYAISVVNKIHSKGKLPIVVGGTGLYIDGYIYDFEFGGQADPVLRAKLELLSLYELQEQAQAAGIDPNQINYQNPRHLSRAIERGGIASNRKAKSAGILIIGLRTNKEEQDERIAKRVDTMFKNGLIQEVQNLIKLYGQDAPGLLSPGYNEAQEYINGTLDLEETKQAICRSHRQLAKRQNTWFKRNQDIKWCDTEQQAHQNIRAFLARFATIEP